MRLIIYLLSVFVTTNICFGQGPTEQELKQISSIDNFYFYGFDISKTKVTDPKRGGQDLSNYMHQLVGEMALVIDEKRMTKWFKVQNVTYKLNGTYHANKPVKSEDLFYPNYMPDMSINRDSVALMIGKYTIQEASGIGFVVIYEYFSRERKSVSGYGCFFDIKTREIISLMNVEAKDGNSYRSFRDYWVPAAKVVKEFADSFRDIRDGKHKP